MRDDLKLLGEAFRTAPRRFARVAPDGFRIGEEIVPVLRGTIQEWTLVRKLFRKGRVACSSRDGVEGAGAERCASCKREGCSPRIRLRIHPAPGGGLDAPDLELELNFSSCRNFLDYARELAAAHLEVHEAVTVFSVLDRAKWGEVRFASDRQPSECRQEA